ncbi:outer membrane beta-barrel protein [Roseimicrobium sp. ORNL1]|uniref:outer membrane protein n=1 Tax=Roseimicrobium sp. ORNL1 TaxID=2711231 RepID=UPI0013E1A40D|nr:outer membrane beta-barrel protein [Roseimicrobium sp. ORNL1]QIF05081.1 porin family protein [Roseimicrobium sp. ORNL1]
MKILRTSFLALLGLAMVATSQAGTYTSSKGVVAPTPAPAPQGGLYFSVAGGALWLDDVSYGPASLDFDTGFSVLGAVGYSFGNGLSVELESGYLGVDSGEGHIRGLGNADVEGEFRQVPIFANALYTVDVTDVVGIYVGGGLGIVWSDTEIDSVGGFHNPTNLGESDEWNFAAQAKAGVSFKVTEAASLNIGYRFFYGQDAVGGLDDSIGHILEGGLTIRF